ncbi:cytochrome oxidase assembly [Golovinomyces cichoracearum]|uniref:Cytochrome oxidase assembly n=1 Tax=Golovinomyces cichoracearum TaxID=62708 RepID=A0A420IS22_9PEZI|nr:cytochrome oxidase assembly [Golovinomyces cichoracearum]
MFRPITKRISQRILASSNLYKNGAFTKFPAQTRALVAAPKPEQGPLMERRSDRELPGSHLNVYLFSLFDSFVLNANKINARRKARELGGNLGEINNGGMLWLRTIPIFLVILGSSCLAIFNYQKSSSSVVASTMYALRTSTKAREVLGDEVYYTYKMPWIWGEINLLHGKIDIHFSVKGTKQRAVMRFTSHRAKRMGSFVTTEWSLETADGEKHDLLEGNDPFEIIDADTSEKKIVGRGSYAPNISG